MSDTHFEAEADSGLVEVSVYAKDTAGNAAWVAMDVTSCGESSFASFTLDQAVTFATTLLAAIKNAHDNREA